jgi:cellulose synthase/poly-beta-1,6-N-acetylglucosamine synthase-like glycosyltransferase
MIASLFAFPLSPLGLLLGLFALWGCLVISIPISVFFLECAFAMLPVRKGPTGQRPTAAVLVPAHNEAQGIAPVLRGILSDLTETDRLIVIADNCTDDTASIARATGATVIERNDNELRGKGYALDCGLKSLRDNPPQVVIVIDADCLVEKGTLERIAATAYATGRPTQALNLLDPPPNPRPKDAVSALAFLVKNWVRPSGLHWLGMPGILTGTGMALPWSVLREASLASGNIVEDMQLSMDLAIAGHPALFCPGTKVLGQLPGQNSAAKTQRTRWEHGHLSTIKTQVPRLIRESLKQRRIDLFVIAMDLSVPPLSLLVMLWGALMAACVCLGFVTHVWLPATIVAIQGGMVGVAILAAWIKFGRQQLPARTLLSVPFYLMWKIPLYVSYMLRPQTKWVRTERDANPPQPPQP